jgi:hypothetical protein
MAVIAFGAAISKPAVADFRQQTRFFGTLGAGSADAPYPYAGIDNGTNVQSLSRFGINYSVTDDRDLSFFAELVAQPKQLEAPWYFVNWRPHDTFMARAGRMRFASWIYSETRAIGYNYPWPALPLDVYQFNPFDGLTGLSGEYTFQTPHGRLAFEAQIGSVDGSYLGTRITSDIAYVANVSFSADPVTLMLSGLYADSRWDSTAFQIKNLEAGYVSAGVKANLGNFVIISEGVILDASASNREKQEALQDSLNDQASIQADPTKAADQGVQLRALKAALTREKLVSSNAAYMHLGYEFNSFHPYVLAATVNSKDDAAIGSSQMRYACGLVWYAAEQLALKVQASYVDLDQENTGLLEVPMTPGTKKIEPVVVGLGSIDFLF